MATPDYVHTYIPIPVTCMGPGMYICECASIHWPWILPSKGIYEASIEYYALEDEAVASWKKSWLCQFHVLTSAQMASCALAEPVRPLIVTMDQAQSKIKPIGAII